jgi:hypothetical protein
MVAPASARAIESGHLRGVSQDILDQLRTGRLPDKPTEARALLETAIIQQYRAIADGLLADMLISGEEVDHLTWWQHYAGSETSQKQPRIDLESPAFDSFRQRFVRDVALRKIRRIKRSELYSQEVAIYGGVVYWWEEGRVNRQLAAHGSSLRLLVVDTDRLRFHRLRVLAFQYGAQTEESVPPPTSDGRFLLGETGPFSAYRLASFFNFRREFATAPRMMPGVGGFADNFRAVARPHPSHMTRKNLASNEHDEVAEDHPDTEDAFTLFDGVVTLAHEYTHIQTNLSFRRPGETLSSWRSVVREDLCRYAAKPRQIEEFVKYFSTPYVVDFDTDSGISRWDVTIEQIPDLAHDIEDLAARGLLTRLPDGRYVCCSFGFPT